MNECRECASTKFSVLKEGKQQKKKGGFRVVSFTSFSFPLFSEVVFFHLQSLTRHQEESPKSWRWSEELTNALHLMMP
jgi:hypothetical protein